MLYESFIARRYLFSRERGALVTIITLISILGVAIGVCALVVVISVMDGADDNLFRKMIDIDAHVEIMAAGKGGFTNYSKIVQAIDEVPGVKAAAPAVIRQGAAIVKSTLTNEPVPEGLMIAGIDPEREILVSGMNRHVTPENLGPLKEKEIVLGQGLAERLGKNIGDELRVVTTFGTFAGRMMPMYRDLKVVGTLKTGLYDFDRAAAYVSMPQAQSMFLVDEAGEPMDVATTIRVSVDDPFDMDITTRNIFDAVRPLVPRDSWVETWQTKNELFFNALQLEKWGLFIILMLVVIVAAFNIIGTQILVVIQKTPEVGILMSMGVPRRSIRRVFWSFGFIIGLLGTVTGVLLGFAICWVLANTDIIPIKGSVYGLDRLPVIVKPFTVAIIVFSSMAICTLASVFPAWRASRMNPVEALRYE